MTGPSWRPTPLRRAVIILGWMVLIASIAGIVTGALQGGLVTWVVTAAMASVGFLVASAVPDPAPLRKRRRRLGAGWQDLGSPLDAYRAHGAHRAEKRRSILLMVLRYPPAD